MSLVSIMENLKRITTKRIVHRVSIDIKDADTLLDYIRVLEEQLDNTIQIRYKDR